MRRLANAALILVLVFAFLPLASAQSTGGSFGGGDWGGGGGTDFDYGTGGGTDYGGGGSTDFSSPSDTSSSDSYDYDVDTDDGGGSRRPSTSELATSMASTLMVLLGTLAIVVVYFLLALVWYQIMDWRRSRRSPPRAGRTWRSVDVTAVSLAIDWRARKNVQAKLDEFASSALGGTAAGRMVLLGNTIRLLRTARLSWLYAGVVNHKPMNQSSAQGIFRGLGVDARARFQVDVIRSYGEQITRTKALKQKARPEEGPGVVVVTLIVAARREILDVPTYRNAEDIDELLSAILATEKDQLVALEVVWSPAVENDRMSTAELTVLYPEFERLSERSVGGRVFCAHCGGPFADELRKCSHCGAPNPRHEAADEATSPNA